MEVKVVIKSNFKQSILGQKIEVRISQTTRWICGHHSQKTKKLLQQVQKVTMLEISTRPLAQVSECHECRASANR